jgi:hypothetical protein
MAEQGILYEQRNFAGLSEGRYCYWQEWYSFVACQVLHWYFVVILSSVIVR